MKAFVIRLKGIDSSESLAQECILSGHRNNLHIELFDGIFGEEDIKSVTATYGIRPLKEGMKKNRLGVIGCFLSHYTLWLKCIKLNEPLIIFEQDAVVLSSLPDDIDSKYKECSLSVRCSEQPSGLVPQSLSDSSQICKIHLFIFYSLITYILRFYYFV